MSLMSHRPPKPLIKDKKSITPARQHRTTKITLTDVQRIKVDIIDWKRCSVRCLLLILYVTLGHVITYLTIIGTCYPVIIDSLDLQYALIGFCFDLFLYFFGTCVAVRAIEFAWNPIKFVIGVITVIIAIIGNFVCQWVGQQSSEKFEEGLPKEKIILCQQLRANEISEEEIPPKFKRWGFVEFSTICDEMDTVKTAIWFLPLLLPPVAAICLIISFVSAVEAIYIVPNRSKETKVDAAWLQPYETYDFYVGRNIPRIPGYDGAYEGAVVDTTLYMVSDSDSAEDMDTDATAEGDDEDHPKKKKGRKKGLNLHPQKAHPLPEVQGSHAHLSTPQRDHPHGGAHGHGHAHGGAHGHAHAH